MHEAGGIRKYLDADERRLTLIINKWIVVGCEKKRINKKKNI